MGLFDEKEIQLYLKGVSQKIGNQLDNLSDDEILENEVDDLVSEILANNRLLLPEIDYQPDSQVDVINRTINSIRGGGKARIQVAIYKLNFSGGDSNLLKCIPIPYPMKVPVGKVYDNYLKFEVQFYGIIDGNERGQQKVVSDAKMFIELIKSLCDNLERNCSEYLSTIRAELNHLITLRKKAIQDRKDTQNGLSF